MADPAQLDQSATQGQVPEVPLGPSVAGAYASAAYQNSQQSSPKISRKRRPSEARSVNVDFFDPEGVKELRREISHASDGQLSAHAENSESESDHTTLQDGRFDLEKTLREIMQK